MKKDFTELSLLLTKKLSLSDKKTDGIYFTSPNTISSILDKLSMYKTFNTVLEPSCGSCEFINFLDKKYDDITIDGIENNSIIFNEINKLNWNNQVNLINKDFLQYDTDKKYDLIIGNPPYFVYPKKKANPDFLKYFTGRPNIYILFIIHCLKFLEKDGILSLIIPKNFINCSYYNKLRVYLNDNFEILDIMNIDGGFIDTKQETICIVIRNSQSDNTKFVYNIDDYIFFNNEESLQKIKKLLENSTTISQLGFEVRVGNIVWNQVKDILTDDDTKTRLIYNSDIVDNKLEMKNYTNISKKNFINKEGFNKLSLVINRGYGNGIYKFNYCLINIKENYLIENHLICITHIDDINEKDLYCKYMKIMKSFSNEKTQEFISLYFGNNSINTRELEYILPIFL